MAPTFRASFLAALPAGAAILVAFFVWHWYNIAPVWTVLVEGTVGIAIAAAGVALAWREARAAGRFAGRWGGLAFGGVFAAGILLSEAIGLAHGPWPTPTSVAEALPILAFVLIPVAGVVAAGRWLSGNWRGTGGFSASALVLLLYLGGSVLQRGGVGLGLGLFLILFPGYLLAGVIVGVLQPRLERTEPAPAEPPGAASARSR